MDFANKPLHIITLACALVAVGSDGLMAQVSYSCYDRDTGQQIPCSGGGGSSGGGGGTYSPNPYANAVGAGISNNISQGIQNLFSGPSPAEQAARSARARELERQNLEALRQLILRQKAAGASQRKKRKADKDDLLQELKGTDDDLGLKGDAEDDLGLKTGSDAEPAEKIEKPRGLKGGKVAASGSSIPGLSLEEAQSLQAAKARLRELNAKANTRVGALSPEERAEAHELRFKLEGALARVAVNPDATVAERELVKLRIETVTTWVGKHPGGYSQPDKAPGWGQSFSEPLIRWGKRLLEPAEAAVARLKNSLPDESPNIAPGFNVFDTDATIQAFTQQPETEKR